MVKQLGNIFMSVCVLVPSPYTQRGAGSHCRGKPQTATFSQSDDLRMLVKVGKKKQAKMQRFIYIRLLIWVRWWHNVSDIPSFSWFGLCRKSNVASQFQQTGCCIINKERLSLTNAKSTLNHYIAQQHPNSCPHCRGFFLTCFLDNTNNVLHGLRRVCLYLGAGNRGS